MTAAAIRHLGADDVQSFRAIRLEALRTEPDAFTSSLEEWQALDEAEWRRRLTDNPVFVAFLDGEPVGIMGLLRPRAAKMAHRATIVMVYVRGQLRGTGLAGALLGALTGHARSIGVRLLELSVSARNPAAHRFYLRHGYDAVGRIPGGILEEDAAVDEILMVRRIADA